MSDRSFEGYVSLRQVTDQGMVSVRASIASKKVRETLKNVTGVAMPGQMGANAKGRNGLLWMSPDEALVLVPNYQASAVASEIGKTLSNVHALVVDVSDARAVFELNGQGAAEVISKLAPADIMALAPNQLARTRLAQVAAALWKVDADIMGIICFRSVQDYVFDILSMSIKNGRVL